MKRQEHKWVIPIYYFILLIYLIYIPLFSSNQYSTRLTIIREYRYIYFQLVVVYEAVHVSPLPLFSFSSFFCFVCRFYSSPYSIATNRMIPQTSITPFIAASPVSTYQVCLNRLIFP